MQILSALDAISPAFARTKLVLFTPFRKGRTWKLAVTAYLSVMGTLFLPFMLIALFFIPLVRKMAGSSAVTILIGVSITLTLIYLLVFWLCSHLRFAFFDIVLNRGQFVAPAWRKYGSQAFQWTAFKVALCTLVTAAVAAPMSAAIHHFVDSVAALQFAPGQKPPPEMMNAIFAGYAAFFLIYLGMGVFFWLSSLLSDFIVPSLALEDTTLVVAFQRLGQLIRREPGQFTLYAVLKLGLALSGYVAQMIVFYAAFLIAVVGVGLVALIIGLILHAIGVSMTVLTVLGVIVGMAVYLMLCFYAMPIAIGTVMTFLEAYALYFLGGRYPLLGERLDLSTPPVQRPEPVYPPYLPTVPPPSPLE
jgi:hypothetical protein